jgi:Holliday junction DNA helicase RuvB
MKPIGNLSILFQINIALSAAQEAGRALPHMIFSGAAGCGKTTMAKHLAEISNCQIFIVACDALKTRLDVALLAQQFSKVGYDPNFGDLINGQLIQPSIVFIDEIHNLSLAAQEHLGIAMEEWYLPITAKEARIMNIKVNRKQEGPRFWIPSFTLVGATTNDGRLSKPFRDRFKMRFVFAPYSIEESIQIVFLHAERLKTKVDEHGAMEIAKRGRGVPRVLVSLLERCRDAALATHQSSITKELARVAFSELGIDATGLTPTDINLLLALHRIGDPVGLDNLSTILNESPKVLSETVEPYLIQRGLMLRSSKGRTITEAGCEYLSDRGYIEKESRYERVAITADYDRGF